MERPRALQVPERSRIRALDLRGQQSEHAPPTSSAEDEELVRGLLAGEDLSVERFIERYRPLFLHCIGHFEADPVAREDLLQNLLWHTLERLRQGAFDGGKGAFGTWLYRVAWCRAVDLKRKENARRRVPLQLVDEDLPEEPDPQPGPEQAAGDEEVGALVRASLAEIEPEERDLLVLRFVDGLTLTEVAERVQLSLEQTKYRVKRASSALRKALIARLPRAEAIE